MPLNADSVTTPARRALTPLQRWQSVADFRDLVSQTFVPLQVSTRRPHHFHAATRATTAHDFKIIEIVADEHVVERTRRLIDDAAKEPCYKLSLMLEGSGYICQDGRDAVLGPGDLVVYDTSRPYTLAFDDSSIRSVVAVLPKRLVELSTDRVAQLTATALSKDDQLGGMVGTVLSQLAGRLELVNATTGWRLARNAIDLVNILLRDSLHEDPTLPAARLLDAIYAYIEEHLADPDLSPSAIAAAHYISVRYLHTLFQNTGTSVSAFVRTRRLERCRTDLADPTHASETVTAISSRWSFADAAHFSRTFKSAYGLTPTEFRAQIWA
ncbi:helix-turn-helix domain-containing protein [Micromonospora sp. KC606]|uniref:AraC-like ligand-binding domain-containing protein n=1 Tax=Micromonospora sp. KC606 TaxID=2530379 RepID=UPI0010466E45|nr:helix-turn-helix domain-containing protein [Micromonospora sp. KC606]TDC83798.1 helix-turn-helix domain-containing protein [Micromonospora sp. KC606]